jgi:RND family efflux transporter MFP subunit
VEKILVKRGEIVERGQELVKLEDKQEHLNYLKAKNEYELAKIAGSPSQIEEKKLTMEVALDKYESKTLRAPFSGKVVDIFVEEGDFIEGTDDVVYLIDDSSYEVTASISEVDCLKVAVGQEVEIELDILKGQIFQGIVTEVAEYAKVESGVVTVPVTLRINEVSPYFKPGFSATAEIIVDNVENALIIPITALSTGERGNVVLKVEGDKAIPTIVQVGINNGFYQEIIEGLQEGDRIIINSYRINNIPQTSSGGFGGMRVPGPIPMMR